MANPAFAQDTAEAPLIAAIDASETPAGALALARQQIAAGEPLEAAATLERALIARPNSDEVRLAYAALLCRLGDGQAARLELQSVTGRSSIGWDEVRSACGDNLPRPPAASYLGGRVTLGLAWDSDALGETLIQPAGTAADDGLAGVATVRLDGRLALGRAFLFGEAGGIAKQSISGPDRDYQYGSADLGLGLGIGAGEIAAGGTFRYARIGNQRYLSEYGGVLRLSFPEGESGGLTLRAEAVRQDFHQPGFDGWSYGASFTYNGQVSDRTAWFLSAGAEFKSAERASNEYSATRLSAGIETQLGSSGTYASFQSTVRRVVFGEEAFVPLRRDWRFYNRAALGLPLGVTGLALEAAVTHSYRNYNAASFLDDYSSFGGELRLVWKFGRERTPR